MRQSTAIIWCRRPGKLYSNSFATNAQAHAFIVAVLDGAKLRWISHSEIEFADCRLSCADLEEILETQPGELPEPYASQARQFRGKAVKITTCPPPMPARVVTASQLAKELDMTPRELRAQLRKLKIRKQGRWEWSAADAEGIKRQLQP